MMTKDIQEGKRSGIWYFLSFIATVFLANYFISNIGTRCIPKGPCLIPVGFGLDSPSGVLWAGIGFTLRDLLQRRWGVHGTFWAIFCGAVLSAFLSPALALASGLAFFFSELADMFVYTPLQKRHFVKAVIASNLVGLVVDSALFLYLAFGSFKYISGQVVGKAWMTVLVLPLVIWLRNRDEKKGFVR